MSLSAVIVHLLKGVIYRDEDEVLWMQMLELQPQVRDYVVVLNLELVADEAEGYAFLKARKQAEEEDPLPRLIARRALSFPVSLLLALLRKKLAEFDAAGGGTRLILSREEVVDLMRLFFPEGSNEVRRVDQIDTYLNKVADLGFVRQLKGQPHMFEVRRILKAFVDAQWLSEFDRQLSIYRAHAEGKGQ